MKAFPDLPGVYLFKDKQGRVIYVGKAKSLRSRVASYFKIPVSSPKTAALLKHYHHIDFIVAKTELEALLLESRLIKKYLPRYNVQWRDDKQYPYIKLTLGEEWPQLLIWLFHLPVRIWPANYLALGLGLLVMAFLFWRLHKKEDLREFENF